MRSTWMRVQLRSTALAGLVAVVLCGCTNEQRYEYLARSDTVTLGAGDAPTANKVTHTVDPWPANSQRTAIDMDGKRAAIAIRRYETNTSIKPKGINSDPGTILNGSTPANGTVKN